MVHLQRTLLNSPAVGEGRGAEERGEEKVWAQALSTIDYVCMYVCTFPSSLPVSSVYRTDMGLRCFACGTNKECGEQYRTQVNSLRSEC